MKEISTIGLDIAKSKFRIVGLNRAGRVVKRQWLYREEVLSYLSNLNRCLVGMEACAGAHYWGRELEKVGHEVKLMPPKYVKPYVKTNKNDTNDAEACAEAVTRPTMRFASIKSERQQALAQLHRVRERLIKVRTALGNEIRGFLGEFGIVLPKGIEKLRERVVVVLEKNRDRLSAMTLEMINRLCAELKGVDEEVDFYEKRITIEHESMPESKRLGTIPGIGKITATAIVAGFSNAGQFKNGRHFAAFLGLVPGQHSTGGKSRLGGVSKRGDVYIRKLLVQGANSVLKTVKGKKDPYSCWVQALLERRGWCRTAVAIANKNARIAWSVLARGVEFDAKHEPERLAA